MDFAIRPATEAGGALVELCEKHAADFATRADEHDREGSFPFENIAALRESGVMNAGLPVELGGLGVISAQDHAAAMNRLGRGDGSTAIAANMHIGTIAFMHRLWADALERGDTEFAEKTYGLLQVLFGITVCIGGTEAGTSIGYPLTEATPVDGGWRLNGRKIFGTLSPVADIIIVICRFRREADQYGWAFAFVPRDADGLTINDDWDALGMRASGSNSMELDDCFVPDDLFQRQPSPWGTLDVGLLTIQVTSNLALSSVMVGIAEQARDLVLQSVTTRRKAPSNRLLSERTGIQYQVAEMEIDLSTARSMIERCASVVDSCLSAHGESKIEVLQDLMREFQSAKWVANRKAIDVVDRAMTISGGAGYFSNNPLSRLYRDVRAGPFMQAYSPNEAREFIGRNVLGLGAELDL
jgi:alkylation response protein AidB-like acyl-CoA dehydrogenase